MLTEPTGDHISAGVDGKGKNPMNLRKALAGEVDGYRPTKGA